MRDHVAEGVVQGLEIGIELVLEVARQEAEAFACFDGRAGEDDPLDFPVLKGAYGEGDGDVGLAGAGRTNGEYQVVVKICLDHLLLGEVAGAYGLAVRAVHDDGVAVEAEAVRRGLAVEYVLDIVDGQVHLAVTPLYQFVELHFEVFDTGFLPVQDDLVAARDDFQLGVVGAELLQDLVARSEDFDGVNCFQLDGFPHIFRFLSLLFCMWLSCCRSRRDRSTHCAVR